MQKVIRTGNSIAVTIPAKFAKTVGVRAGDGVEVETKPESGKILYTFTNMRQLPLSEKIFVKQ